MGAMGTILGAVAIGRADVDAITVSIARLPPQTLSEQSAVVAILAASATNMLSKLMIGTAVGNSRFALYLAGISAAFSYAAFFLQIKPAGAQNQRNLIHFVPKDSHYCPTSLQSTSPRRRQPNRGNLDQTRRRSDAIFRRYWLPGPHCRLGERKAASC
jgi:hypothetical protein